MNLIKLLLFSGSRKVAFGLWLFIAAVTLLILKLISSDQWMLCVALTSGLIGGGTVADAWINKKPNA